MKTKRVFLIGRLDHDLITKPEIEALIESVDWCLLTPVDKCFVVGDVVPGPDGDWTVVDFDGLDDCILRVQQVVHA